MTDLVQNDWEIVEEALLYAKAEAVVAFGRLRESNRSMVAGLIERISELEAELAEVQRQEWPRPSNL